MDYKIMTPDHPLWDEYLQKLSRRLYHRMDMTSRTRCKGDFTWTRRILANMKGIDVEASIEYLRANFGDCDEDVLDIAN